MHQAVQPTVTGSLFSSRTGESWTKTSVVKIDRYGIGLIGGDYHRAYKIFHATPKIQGCLCAEILWGANMPNRLAPF